jgi:hypothetical protein
MNLIIFLIINLIFIFIVVKMIDLLQFYDIMFYIINFNVEFLLFIIHYTI